jgi:CRISPR-associated protein Cas2
MAAADKRWRLVAYDIRDPARWRKVYRIMRGAGERVQYSLFRCRLDSRAIERLRWRLSRVMSPEDNLLVVDLCPTCASNVIARNQVDGWETRPPTFRIIGTVTDADHGHAAGDDAPGSESQEDVLDRGLPGSLEKE